MTRANSETLKMKLLRNQQKTAGHGPGVAKNRAVSDRAGDNKSGTLKIRNHHDVIRQQA
jgi:hypothetical protein